jgi:hypothetical protein
MKHWYSFNVDKRYIEIIGFSQKYNEITVIYVNCKCMQYWSRLYEFYLKLYVCFGWEKWGIKLHTSLYLCFILRRKSEERASKKYMQGIFNLLIVMNISVLHGVWSYPYVLHFPCPVECKHNKVRRAVCSMIVPIHFLFFMSHIMHMFSKSLVCCVGRKFLKLGCGGGNGTSLSQCVKPLKFTLQRVKVILTI